MTTTRDRIQSLFVFGQSPRVRPGATPSYKKVDLRLSVQIQKLGEKQMQALVLPLTLPRLSREERGNSAVGVKGYGFSPSDTSTCKQWKGGCCLGSWWASKETGKTLVPVLLGKEIGRASCRERV